MHLSPEHKKTGRQNYFNALGVTRRDFLKAAAVAPAAGAFYFGYTQLSGDPVRAGLIGTGHQGSVLLSHSNPEYLRFTAFSDIRPSQIQRIKYGDEGKPLDAEHQGFLRKYDLSEVQFEQEVQQYDDYRQLLEDKSIELVVIALPLHLHHQVAVEALAAGKHVFCETLMAQNLGQCKELARQAADSDLHFAVGHQRHYSILYNNALSMIETNLLGDVRHIRALWHRNNSWPVLHNTEPLFENGILQLQDSWREAIPTPDLTMDYQSHGYESLEELVWWPLYRRTGGGLMAESGSHQLDACSLLLGESRPLAVSGIGSKSYFEDDREVDDHVFVTLEYPGFEHPQGKHQGSDPNDIVIVTYSCLGTNAFENYGEQIMGTRGTMFIEQEQDVLLYKEAEPGETINPSLTEVVVSEKAADQAAMVTSASDAGSSASSGWAQANATGVSGRGYREQLEHLAWCIRNPDSENRPRCGAGTALVNAVTAVTADLAIAKRQRIEFKAEWFDVGSDEVPDGV